MSWLIVSTAKTAVELLYIAVIMYNCGTLSESTRDLMSGLNIRNNRSDIENFTDI